jgi:hypothetical protein
MTRVRYSLCPWCGKRHDLIDAVVTKEEAKTLKEEPRAENGDATVCLGCGQFSIFDDKVRPGGLRFPTKEESEDIHATDMVAKVTMAFGRIPGWQPRAILKRPDWY